MAALPLKPLLREMRFVFAIFGAIVLVTTSLLLSSCESSQADNQAQAQKCLDGLGSSPTPAEAQNCLTPISGDYSANAEVVRCSADFIIGGITESTLVNDYETIKTNNISGNQVAATLMPDLALKDSSGNYSTTFAEQTYNDCTASNTSSFVYMAGLAEAGTIMTLANASNPSTAAAYCSTNPNNCSPTQVGTIAQTVASTYCTGSNQTSSVCTTINNAIASGNGNPTTIGQNLLGSL